MTLSGGEPLLQRDFMLALLREAKRRRINTSMETCGLAPWENLHDACKLLDSILLDIKTLNAAKHLEHTGAPLAPVLENFERMMATFPKLAVHLRTPIVPGFNDTPEDVTAIAKLVVRYPNADYEMLPYHRLGTQKYAFLGRSYPMGEVALDERVMDTLYAAVREADAVAVCSG
jgi:pyruvate formate lyase activating enzyme